MITYEMILQRGGSYMNETNKQLVCVIVIITLVLPITGKITRARANDTLDDPEWNSVALFFNLPIGHRPSDYLHTTVGDALEFLDQGSNPAEISISEFISNYWKTISLNHIRCGGVETPREASSNTPIVFSVAVGGAWGGDCYDWGGIINACLDTNPEAIWNAAGHLMKDGKRWIPSIFLVQHYGVGASAGFGGYERTISGNIYLIGDTTHIPYNLAYSDFPDTPLNPDNHGRRIWGTLCHEMGHNFAEFWDYYGPTGCTGYWDLLGDNSLPGRMSEIGSFAKERIGWIDFKEVITGPSVAEREIILKPYTTTGEAIKIVPDPTYNPKEYFLLEYRKSTGTELWRPDGGLPEEGLLITHMNERLGIPNSWLMREAPFFDPEFADFSDKGTTLWTGLDKLRGVLYPQPGGRNKFTPDTYPNSDFYGKRHSGLSITNIHINEGKCYCTVKIDCPQRVGWTVSKNDRCLAGRFTSEGKDTLFMRNNNAVSLLVYQQGQWMVRSRQERLIDRWRLGTDNYEVVGDFDGDGRDEIYIRSPFWGGILKYNVTQFSLQSMSILPRIWLGIGRMIGLLPALKVLIAEWFDPFIERFREFAADVDGDGNDEIIATGPEYLGVIDYNDTLQLRTISYDWIDDWNLGANDTKYVGRFTQKEYDEILLRSPEYLGVVYCNSSTLRLCSIQFNYIRGVGKPWKLAADDKQTIGDFDGDGYDEIYMRNGIRAGLLKWNQSSHGFRLIWEHFDYIEPMDDRVGIGAVELDSQDISYAGWFVREPNLPIREGILHRSDNLLAILTWETDDTEGVGMKVRQKLSFPCEAGPYGPQWSLYSELYDKFILGDFHEKGRDIADPHCDYTGDNLTDIFIYRPQVKKNTIVEPSSTMIGVNYVEWTPRLIHEDIGMLWYNHLRFSSGETFMFEN